MSDIEFADGLRVYTPHVNAPDFVKGQIVIERDKLIAWLQSREDHQVRLDIKESRKGGWYVSVNTFQARHQGRRQEPQQEPTPDDGLPW